VVPKERWDMIRFNNIALESIVPFLRNTISVSPPKVDLTWQDKTLAHGSRFMRRRYEPREIKIDIYLPIVSAEQRAHFINLIYGWVNYDEPMPLELPNIPGKYIMASAEKLPDPTTREWWEKLSITFIAGDPFFIDSSYSAATNGTVFAVYGDSVASAYIIESGVSINPSWVLDGDKSISLDGAFIGTMKIDLDDNMVYLDDISQMEYVTLASRFFELVPGIHTITGAGTLYYKQRWL
jgi:phage-related protein